ncbi:MAG: leucyl/phenylalanyl-tRNA--protein transferase [Tepidisphaera sp.]|nr:leucyl/phenylalanyl-tRNA--protein transferase [Tepidisphaera sp.]
MPPEPAPREPPTPEQALQWVLSMYRQGWFPMYDDASRQVQWVQPHHRGIIPLDDRFTASRSLRALVRRRHFVVTSDTAFIDVIEACAAPAKGREDTWLSDEIIDAFVAMHEKGLAHSIEVWTRGPRRTLVGGLYGLRLGSVFCGESMFSRPDLGGTNASKVALVHLVHHLRRQGFTLLDSQMENDHLAQFGCFTIPREEYLRHLVKHALDDACWGDFDADFAPGQFESRSGPR